MENNAHSGQEPIENKIPSMNADEQQTADIENNLPEDEELLPEDGDIEEGSLEDEDIEEEDLEEEEIDDPNKEEEADDERDNSDENADAVF